MKYTSLTRGAVRTLLATVCLVPASTVFAAVWVGGPPNPTSLATKQSWSDNNSPTNGTILTFNTTGTQISPLNNDILTSVSLGGIEFNRTNALSIQGNAFSFNGAATTVSSTSSGNLSLPTGLSNSGTTTFSVTGSGSVTVGAITSSAGLVKNGSGSGALILAQSNSYTGPTTINAGTLQLGASNVLPATTVVLNGGTLNTAGFSDSAGSLDVNGAATINLNVADSLAFAASNTETWTGTLAIWNWEQGSTSLRFGTNATGLTSTQLSSISVFGGSGSEPLGPFGLDSGGFLVPVPEPGAVVAALALLGVVGWRERRSFLRVRGCAA